MFININKNYAIVFHKHFVINIGIIPKDSWVSLAFIKKYSFGFFTVLKKYKGE